MLAWEAVLNISGIFNTVICNGGHYSWSGKVQVRQDLTVCYGRTSASKQREQKGRPSSLTSDPPAPGLEKDEVRQATEKGLGEFKGLLSTEWWTQHLKWRFGLFTPWLVDWWLLSSGGCGWQMLKKCLLQMLIEHILTQVTSELVTHLLWHKRILRSWRTRALPHPKVEGVLQPDPGPSAQPLLHSLTLLATSAPYPPLCFFIICFFFSRFFYLLLSLILSPPKYHFSFLKCSKRNAAWREGYMRHSR